MADDDLRDFEAGTFTHEGETKIVLRKGSGPAVIVIAEMPGISPKVANFARKVADIGCTAVMPHLFGNPGQSVDPKADGWLRTATYGLSSIFRGCVSREFTVLATGKSSPAVAWLRALAQNEHERNGGPGVGAIGMCFTGGYALAMAADDRLLAPVLSQPSLPFGLTKNARHNIDISPADLEKVKHRCQHDGLKVLGMRFTSDKLVPAERFEFLKEELGDGFIAIELPGETANPDSLMPAHSVVTEHLIDEPGQPTREALDQVLELFRSRLLATT
ncbi:dienelactone hydrolase [Mycobacterium sp. CBMA271]|uniref:dienelactone hydrolase family protein n=1 Tax=unclassified Mycobacteroides TaxID=2618759 RepID=UPI0012DF7A5C|nr:MULTISPECIES: dienelactone hydrolase family protein [unclassified Mycobacteroides]MUM17936.1 dienelactone hydrolase [Mycobacteroides sp. CBMA 326]MUM20505.1 dienelactone hydrolase [Mycobacteroides sp. CBMA 271]